MALTLESINKVRQKCRQFENRPAISENLRALFKHLNTLGNPDLQFVPFTTTGAADVVIADVACKVFAVVATKPAASTTDAWLKGSDHATVAAANGDIAIKLIGTGGGGQHFCATFLNGLIMGTGLTIASHTAVGGNTDSAAGDSASGYFIIGA